MPTARRLALAALAALPLALAACDSTCPTEVAKVNAAPACGAALRPATQVTVHLPVCPKCNQTVPSCAVVPPADPATDNQYQLDATVQACSSDNSCPVSYSCPNPPPTAACTFTTPALGLAPGDAYEFLIIDPNGGATTAPFTVAADGATSCTSG